MNIRLDRYLGLIIVTLGFLLSVILRWRLLFHELIGIHLWRQAQTQWNVRNFYRGLCDIFNPCVAYLNEDMDSTMILEFPLMQWLIAGVHSVSASDHVAYTRWSLLCISFFTILGFYRFLQELTTDHVLAGMTTVLLIYSPMFYYYSINPHPDNMAMCFSMWSLVWIQRSIVNDQFYCILLASIFLTLAALCKLPFVIVGAGIVPIVINRWVYNYGKVVASWISILSICMLAPGMWYYRAIFYHWGVVGPVTGVIGSEGNLHEAWDIISFHLFKTLPNELIGFPAIMLFACGAFYVFRHFLSLHNLKYYTLIYGGVAVVFYFLFELFHINIVHDYYLLPFLPFLFFFVLEGLRLVKDYKYCQFFYTGILLFAIASCVYISSPKWTLERSYINDDIFIHRKALNAAVPDRSRCIFLNDGSGSIFSYYMDKWGFTFDSDYLPSGWIKDMIVRGEAKYIYSDSRLIDESSEHNQYFDRLIMQRGSIRLYKLKDKDALR